MSSNDAKTYLSKRNIPGLFECMMTGLMFHRPVDHVQYLIDCLEKVKAKGQEELRWNMFIEMQRSKTPLPPITSNGSKRPLSRERSITPKEEKPADRVSNTPTPLPPIGDRGIPDVPIVFLMGGPGSGKSAHAKTLVQRYPGWVRVAVGDLLKQEVAARAGSDVKWQKVGDLIARGEMAPQDAIDDILLAKLKASHNADGFILQGFPCDMQQAKHYEKLIGRVDSVFLVDCEEETLTKVLQQRAKASKKSTNNAQSPARLIQTFKENTLPVLKYYDDMDKLFILEGEKEVKQIAEDIIMLFDCVIYNGGKGSPVEKSKELVSSRTTTPLPPIRVRGTADVPIVFLTGGPGCEISSHAETLVHSFTSWITVEMADPRMMDTLDVMLQEIHAQGVIIQGFPSDTEQCRKYEKMLGRVDAILLVDCEEQTMAGRLQASLKKGDTTQQLSAYRDNVLPALKRYEDMGKLFWVDGEKEMKQVTEDLVMMFDKIRSGKATGKKGEVSGVDIPSSTAVVDKSIPDVPIVFLAGGPGSGKADLAAMLVRRYPGWVMVPVGELLREEAADRGTAEDKWRMVSDLMSRGEMAPQDVVDTILLDKLRSSHNADGFIITGFPCDMDQAAEYAKMVGRVDAVILVDSEEETLSRQMLERALTTGRLDINVNTVAKRINAFKDDTMPMLKHYEDENKLLVVSGERDAKEITEDVLRTFESVVGTKGKVSPVPTPPKEPRPPKVRSPHGRKTSGSPEPEPEPASIPAHLMPPEIKVKDQGRKAGMPTAPIIFVAGGPGSGKGTQCKRLVERYPNAVHLSMGDILRDKVSSEASADEKWGMVTDLLRMGDLAPQDVTVDLLTQALKDKGQAHFYLVEGFPRNLEQLEDFNQQIGGQSFTVLVDCEEHVLHYRLTVRGKESERIDDNLTAIGRKLTFFKNTTLPILKSIEDDGKLVVVNGDRDDEEITYDLSKVLDYAIYNKLPQQAAGESKDVADQGTAKDPALVEEDRIVPSPGTTTDGNMANPRYSAQLDSLSKSD